MEVDKSLAYRAQRLYFQLRAYTDPTICYIGFLADGLQGCWPPLNLVLMLSLTVSVNGLLSALTLNIGTYIVVVMVSYQLGKKVCMT